MDPRDPLPPRTHTPKSRNHCMQLYAKQNRYLQEDGAEIQAGQPYVEVEAMKMIMPLKAQARGWMCIEMW